jgi:hypothetical protein
MATTYWRIDLTGQRSLDQVMSAVGSLGAPVAGIRVKDTDTQVYLVGDESLREQVMKGVKDGSQPREVTIEEVTTVR